LFFSIIQFRGRQQCSLKKNCASTISSHLSGVPEFLLNLRPKEPPYAYVIGLKEFLRCVFLVDLREFSVERIYPCHCTGKKSIDFLKEQLPGKVFDIGTGSVIEF
jgi:hypothetical protein